MMPWPCVFSAVSDYKTMSSAVSLFETSLKREVIGEDRFGIRDIDLGVETMNRKIDEPNVGVLSTSGEWCTTVYWSYELPYLPLHR